MKLAVDAEMNRYAIKIYSTAKIQAKNLSKSIAKEAEMLRKLDHKNIVKVFDFIEGPHNSYLVMEYCGPVSLRTFLDTTEHSFIDENEARLIFSELARALIHLHSQRIVHRDLKLDNIMVAASGQVKLVDFGLALALKDDHPISSYCGTPCYMAPEIFSKKKYQPEKADVWSFGVCLYRAIVGSFPFRGRLA